jgi:membrane-associated phospholipid phosphatase
MNYLKKWVLILSMLFVNFAAFSQDKQVNKPDSFSLKKDGEGTRGYPANSSSFHAKSLLNLNIYLLLLQSNLKNEFVKPFHMSGTDWKKFGIFAAGTGAIFLVDNPIQQAALKLKERNTPIKDISHSITNLGGVYEGVTLAGFACYGLIFKDQKMVNTALLATQAYITGAAVTTFLKFMTGETRPSYYRPDQVASPRFLGPFTKAERDANGKKTYSSFPSGHTTMAFAVATVFASEYRNKPVIPVLVYTVASLIGISRVTENVHWTTDVFAGAALGYLTGKNILNNYLRFAKIKAPDQQKNTISFNLRYNFGHLEPGLVYTFRK